MMNFFIFWWIARRERKDADDINQQWNGLH